MSKIKEISREYFENDPMVQEMVKQLHSDEVKQAFDKFVTSSEVEDIVEWMRSHGVDINQEMTEFSQELNKASPRPVRSKRFLPFSIRSYEDELKDQIKIDEMKEVIDKQINDGNDLTQLYLILRVSRPALEKLFEEEEIVKAVESFENLGVDLEYLKSTVYELFRWN